MYTKWLKDRNLMKKDLKDADDPLLSEDMLFNDKCFVDEDNEVTLSYNKIWILIYLMDKKPKQNIQHGLTINKK